MSAASHTRRRSRRLAALAAALTVGASTLLLAPAAVAAPPTAALSLTATPAATEGETVTVVISASSVTDLYAYDLTVTVDPALLAFDSGSESGPAGGFTSAVASGGSVTVSHSRLGTSPALATSATTPTIELARLTFTALDGGTAGIVLSNALLVSSTAETLPLTAAASATVSLTALPEPPAPEPDPNPIVVPAPLPSSGQSASPSATPPATVSRPLAATGADATPWLIGGAIGAALVAVGAVLVLRRRSAVTE